VIDGLIADPSDDRVAFAVTAGALVSEILRTRDAGKTWAPLALPGGESWVQLRIDPLSPHALYAIGEHLYRSDDQASTWRVLAKVPERGDFTPSAHPGGTGYLLSES